ncbi:MAG: T9SS type A sorting domain-containing protein [Bacteroidota bacterium]
MTRFLGFLLALLACTADPVAAQVCNGDITLETQAEVDAFDCAEVTGNLFIAGFLDNTSITDLSPLSNLASVGGDINISENDALASLDGLDGIASVDGNLRISLNDALASLDGLDNITSVGGGLLIDINDALATLDGLSNLSSLDEDLIIIGNASLTSLDALGNLSSLGEDLDIRGNAALTSLDGLDNLDSIGRNLLIEFNAALRQCSCGLAGLISGDPPTFSGIDDNITIAENDPDGQCNSPQQVLDDICPTTDAEPTDNTLPEAFVLEAVYPNPFAGVATVGFSLPEAAAVRVVVYDAAGREVAVLVDGPLPAGRHTASFEAAGRASGTYLVRLEAGGYRATQPLTLVR